MRGDTIIIPPALSSRGTVFRDTSFAPMFMKNEYFYSRILATPSHEAGLLLNAAI